METKIESKIVKIEDVKINKKYYPRIKDDWFTVYAYSQSMKSGSKFPAIEIAMLDKKLFLMDGLHRLKATKMIGTDYIQANIHYGLSERDVFKKAIEFNSRHGKILSSQDKAFVIDRLEKLKFTSMEISKLIHIPIDKLEKFKYDKITHTVTGKTVYLKAPMSHFKGQELPEDFNEQQESFNTISQISILKQTLYLIENDLLDKGNKTIMELLNLIKSKINLYFKKG